MSVDAVLFDLDDTLVTHDRPASAVLDLAFESVGVEPFFAVREFQERYETFLPESESIDHLRELIFADIATDAGYQPALGRRIAEVYADERDYSRVSLLPGAQSLLDAIDDRPIGLVTNGDPTMQRPKLDATGLTGRFDTVVFAGHDTASKPNPEPFEQALSDLRVDPPAGAFVGNDPVADVEGAHRAGLRSVWIDDGADSSPESEPDATIDRLDELHDTWLL